MADNFADLQDHIQSQLGEAINSAEVAFGELTLYARRAEIITVLTFLRDDPICKFTQLIDIAGVDYPARARRFDVVYHKVNLCNLEPKDSVYIRIIRQ